MKPSMKRGDGSLVKGIGTDMVQIKRIERLMERLSPSALTRMFTPAELAASERASKPADYLAARFAAKEAVFKAVAHLTPEKTFDLRIIETLNHEDGSPYVNITPALREILDKAAVTDLMVSITTEGEYAAAFVIAVGLQSPV